MLVNTETSETFQGETLNQHTAVERKSPKGQHYRVKAPSRGGARQGAGRPKGSTTKITLEGLLDELGKAAGVPYEQQLAQNYNQALLRGDWATVRDYDKAFLTKIVADKTAVDHTTGGEVIKGSFQFNVVEQPGWGKSTNETNETNTDE